MKNNKLHAIKNNKDDSSIGIILKTKYGGSYIILAAGKKIKVKSKKEAIEKCEGIFIEPVNKDLPGIALSLEAARGLAQFIQVTFNN